jgi:hypothetical protein
LGVLFPLWSSFEVEGTLSDRNGDQAMGKCTAKKYGDWIAERKLSGKSLKIRILKNLNQRKTL